MTNFMQHMMGGGLLLVLGLTANLAGAEVLPHRTDLSPEDRARVAKVTTPTTVFTKAEGYETNQGGATTHREDINSNAFSHHSANLDFQLQQAFKLGNGLFRKIWVSSPASTAASDGLGPLFNARSCQRCHLKDGRGHPPEDADDTATSMFLRLSVPAKTPQQKAAIADLETMTTPEPTYGTQFQDFAVPGLPAEGRMTVTYEEVPFEMEDGTVISLRKPTYGVTDLAYGPMAPDVLMSPRVAPPMIGLGLLESIHIGDIKALADPTDKDGDGISGKPQWVRGPAGNIVIGRFGYKATSSTIRVQSAGAFAGDVGISTPEAPRHWGDCTPNQPTCLAMPTGVQEQLGGTEAPDPVLDLVSFYSRNLALPPRRNVSDPEVLRGKKLFYEAGCIGCHTPKFVTSRDTTDKVHAFQLIWPYTDMLLHDMGEGLSDNRPVGAATGREWRTAPLWGIGLTQTVNGHTFFLHDGRARNLMEAILWHGGEATASRDRFAAMPRYDRQAVLAFLESL